MALFVIVVDAVLIFLSSVFDTVAVLLLIVFRILSVFNTTSEIHSTVLSFT